MKNLLFILLFFSVSASSFAGDFICKISDISPGHLTRYQSFYESDWMTVSPNSSEPIDITFDVIRGRGVESVLEIKEDPRQLMAKISYSDFDFEKGANVNVHTDFYTRNLSAGAGKFYLTKYEKSLSRNDYDKICGEGNFCNLEYPFHRQVVITCRDR